MDLKRIIANNIYMLRNKHKLTQQEFVEKLSIGYTRGHLSNIENGIHMPSAEFIRSVSDTFGVDTNWILSAHNKEYPDLVISDNELELILKYRQLPDDAKISINDIIEIILRD